MIGWRRMGSLSRCAVALAVVTIPAAAQIYSLSIGPTVVPAGATTSTDITIRFDYFSCNVMGNVIFTWTRTGFTAVTKVVALPASFGGNIITTTLTIPSAQLLTAGTGTVTFSTTYSSNCFSLNAGQTGTAGIITATNPSISLPIVPSASAPGGASLPITVFGDNFVPGQSKIAFDGTSLASTAVAGMITATIPGGSLTAGTHAVRVRNNDTVVSSSPDSPSVNFYVGAATTTALVSSTGGGAATQGQAVTLTATVSGGAGSPTGLVTFYDGSQVLGTGSVSARTATLSTRFLSTGVRALTAVYGGDATSAPSRSAVLQQTVSTLGATGFTAASGSPVTVGNSPFGLAGGDFNGDGRLDLAVPNTVSNTVTILLGNSGGGFTAGTPVSATTPSFVATGDFDQDGKADFVVSSDSTDVRVFRGDGAGGFTSMVSLSVVAKALSVAAADFNGDGITDIAVLDRNTGSTAGLHVFLSAGDGTFAAVPVMSLGNKEPWVMAVADFNGDGKADVAIPNRAAGNDTVSILRGAGDGTFLTAVNYPVGSGSRPAMVAVGDFDQNGTPDIVTANAGGGGISVLLNNGDGTFGTARVFATGAGASGLAIEDFNGDGLADVAVANFTAGNVVVLINDITNKGQNFTVKSEYSFPAGAKASYLVAGDFNRDGRPDMALTLGNTSGQVQVGLGGGPSLTTLSKTTAVADTPGLTLAINGANLVNGSKVIWQAGSGTPVIPDDGGTVTFVSASQLTVAIPRALLTTPDSSTNSVVAIAVQDPLGASSNSLTFTVTPAPSITAVATDRPLVAGVGPRTLTVTGLNFATGAVVRWRQGGVTTSLSTTRQSSTQLTGTLPANLLAAGAAHLTVLDSGGAASPDFATPVSAAPTLTGISPASIGAGSNAVIITLTGTGFTATSQVQWCCTGSGTTLPTNFVSATQLTATISPDKLTGAATAQVTVNDTVTNATTAAQTFTIAAPAITTLSPSSATSGAAAFTLTVTGQFFVSGATVQWCNNCGGAYTDLATTFGDAQTLTATITSGLLAAPATVSIRVSNPGGVTSAVRSFSIVPVSLTSIQPNVVLAGTTNFAFTLTGQNFQPGAVILWNNSITITPSSINNAGTQATATLPNNVPLTAGTVQVSLRNPDGVTTAPLPITVVPLLINPDGLNPSAKPAGSSSFTLTVTGENFASGAKVNWTFGTTTAQLTTAFVDSKTLTAVVDGDTYLKSAGKATVSVSLGTGVSNGVLFSIDGPVMTSVDPPASAVAAPGFTVAVKGSNFLNGSAVQWKVGSAAAKLLATNFVDSGNLTAVVTGDLVAAATVALLSVANPGGSVSNGIVFPVGLAPTVTALNPASVTAGGAAFPLTVVGTNFEPGSVVQWTAGSTTTTLPTGFVDDKNLTASVSSSLISAPGFALISALNKGDLKSNVVSIGITGSAPTLTGLSQSTVAAGSSSVALTVTGTGFSPGSQILVGSTALPTAVVSSVQANATVPANLLTTVGPVNVTVQNAAGTSGPLTLTILGPSVILLNPSSAFRGAPGFTLTVGGANFVQGSAAQWGTTPLTTTFVSSTQLTAVVPANLLLAPGAVNVLVLNPGGASSSAAAFAVGDTATLSALSPVSVPAGSAAFALSVTGTNFTALDTVLWNGLPLATTFLNAVQLNASIPANYLTFPGSVNISVLRFGGSLSNASTFSILGPVLTSLSPSTVSAGGPSFQITATGQNFVAGTVLQWNGTSTPTTFISGTQLNGIVDASFLQTSGPAFITAVNPGGAGSAAVRVAVTGPVLSSLAPASVTAGASALTLTVTGSNFVGGSTVTWNGTSLVTTFLSASQLSAQVPANLTGAAGTAIVQVVSSGNSTSALTFTITAPNAPLLSTLSPASTVAGSASFQLSVNGTGFVQGAVVQWNGAPVATSFVSATQLIALVDGALVAAAGTANVTVQSPGAPQSAALKFAVNPPLITTLTPNTVSAGSLGFNVTVIGLNFVPGSLVQWNATSIPTAYISSTQLTGAVPTAFLTSGAAVSVTVVNPGGAASAGVTFTVGPFNLAVTTAALPDGLVGAVYSQTLSASGGTPPYAWALTSGALPDGLTLDGSSGRISGTPTAAVSSTLTVTVTDGAARTVAKTLSLRSVAALQITTASPLSAALIGTSFSAGLQATGGTPPLLWNGTGLPAGLSINSATGELNGRPVSAGINRFSVSVSDSRQQSFSKDYELTVLDLPSISITAPDVSDSAQQPGIVVSTANPFPALISGALTLTFTPNSTVAKVGGRSVDDAAVQFSTGGRRVTYSLAPGETTARFGDAREQQLFISTGTVAGTISITGTLRIGATEVVLGNPLQHTITIPPAAPVITTLTATPASGGLNVVISGYSNTRELSSAGFTFAASQGNTLGSPEISLNLATVFSGWYGSTASVAAGSQFTITMPFTISGDVSAISSVAVTLTNSRGKSTVVTANTR